MIGRETLEKAYLSQGLSIRQIAVTLGVSPGQVRYWLGRYAIQRRGVGFGALDPNVRRAIQQRGHQTIQAQAQPKKFLVSRDVLKDLYEVQQLTLAMIAQQFEVTPQTVLNRMRRLGLQTRDNDTAKRLGRQRPEVSERASRARRGAKSHLWKGGRTHLYDQIRMCLRMKRWRQAVFERDNFTCQACLKRGGPLHADHQPSFAEILVQAEISTLEQAEALETLWRVEGGRTLCVPCHRKTPNYGKRLTV